MEDEGWCCGLWVRMIHESVKNWLSGLILKLYFSFKSLQNKGLMLLNVWVLRCFKVIRDLMRSLWFFFSHIWLAVFDSINWSRALIPLTSAWKKLEDYLEVGYNIHLAFDSLHYLCKHSFIIRCKKWSSYGLIDASSVIRFSPSHGCFYAV